MSELALTLLRLGFLALLWIVILLVLNFMRRDLKAARAGSTRREAVTPATKAEPARKTRLSEVVVTDESEKRSAYDLVDCMTIGRGVQCSIVLSDDYASTKHATVTREDKDWFYTDLGSTNGSWIDRKRIEAPLKLRRGTTVRIGTTTLRFEK